MNDDEIADRLNERTARKADAVGSPTWDVDMYRTAALQALVDWYDQQDKKMMCLLIVDVDLELRQLIERARKTLGA